jgi:hypothetical protein
MEGREGGREERKIVPSPESVEADSSRPLTFKALFERSKRRKHKKMRHKRKLRPRRSPTDTKRVKDEDLRSPFCQPRTQESQYLGGKSQPLTSVASGSQTLAEQWSPNTTWGVPATSENCDDVEKTGVNSHGNTYLGCWSACQQP